MGGNGGESEYVCGGAGWVLVRSVDCVCVWGGLLLTELDDMDDDFACVHWMVEAWGTLHQWMGGSGVDSVCVDGVGGVNEWQVCGWVSEVVRGWVGRWVGGEWGSDRVCCRMDGQRNGWVSEVKKEWVEEWLGEEVIEFVAGFVK